MRRARIALLRMDHPAFAFRKLIVTACLAALPSLALAATPSEMARWRSEAARVTITRDDWGIAHVRGRSDADAVFGAIYAQAEDDFPRIEANYLTALGRTAEAEGEAAIWKDLRQRLYVEPAELQAQYRASPVWLRRLMDAWADGLNYYLATHPAVRPRVLTRFEPWMALSFTEGSIGGDIERISLSELASFYGGTPVANTAEELGTRPPDPRGSNGIALAPALTRDGHALLLINPHTSFYFRSELQMTSDEGQRYCASTGPILALPWFNPASADATSSGSMRRRIGETIVMDAARLLSLRQGSAAAHTASGHDRLPPGRRQYGDASLCDDAFAPRPDRRRAGGQVDRHRADVEARAGARAKLAADQDGRSGILSDRRGAAGQ